EHRAGVLLARARVPGPARLADLHQGRPDLRLRAGRPAVRDVHEQDEAVTEFSLDAGIEVLTRTPTTLRAMLRGLPSPWIGANEGSDTPSPQDVVGHLIPREGTVWSARAEGSRSNGEQ